MTACPGPEDFPYLGTHFVRLDDLARARGHDLGEVRHAIADRRLPGIPYVLRDGTELVAPDYFDLAELAGSFDALHGWFVRAIEDAAARFPEVGTAEEVWDEYLTGIFAVCLRTVTPGSILAKAALVDKICRLIESPAPVDENWRHELTAAVNALDAIEKPFAQFDRERFGPVSRDRYITTLRERFDLDAPELPIAA